MTVKAHGEVRGAMPARIVGVLLICNGSIMFIVSMLSSDTFNLSSGLIFIGSVLVVLAGIGLINLNLYAWIGATILTLGYVIAQIAQENATPFTGNVSKYIWPTTTLFLLMYSFKACRKPDALQEGLYIRQLPLILASVILLATIIILKITDNSGFLLLGFPALIVEFGLIYVVGLQLQKMIRASK